MLFQGLDHQESGVLVPRCNESERFLPSYWAVIEFTQEGPSLDPSSYFSAEPNSGSVRIPPMKIPCS